MTHDTPDTTSPAGADPQSAEQLDALPPLESLRALDRGVLVRTQREIGRGGRAFGRAADALLGWRAHRGAWVRADDPAGGPAPDAHPGQRVRVGIGPQVLRLGGICRVLDVGRTDDRAGFTYATEPAHVEDGVERFVVALGPDDVVRGVVEAWSQPRSALARHVGPLPWVAPQVITLRYLSALRRAARG
ncbi:DUF1990 family protein [Luteimicrobium subarcticum]|uniref:Uncharacterized protein (UPF0548 family) n=1 Tax=Luteimicrobium subarcticum TaxID=620910 RepID=A0A2M8WS69_9MICO|nr:DUF1990 domain-containing protein [Luteimicrobium subarcticum]PJI93797.1 uncharacterized protein (UPF0548 family) [Luteimicrobium subarcticum]